MCILPWTKTPDFSIAQPCPKRSAGKESGINRNLLSLLSIAQSRMQGCGASQLRPDLLCPPDPAPSTASRHRAGSQPAAVASVQRSLYSRIHVGRSDAEVSAGPTSGGFGFRRSNQARATNRTAPYGCSSSGSMRCIELALLRSYTHVVRFTMHSVIQNYDGSVCCRVPTPLLHRRGPVKGGLSSTPTCVGGRIPAHWQRASGRDDVLQGAQPNRHFGSYEQRSTELSKLLNVWLHKQGKPCSAHVKAKLAGASGASGLGGLRSSHKRATAAAHTSRSCCSKGDVAGPQSSSKCVLPSKLRRSTTGGPVRRPVTPHAPRPYTAALRCSIHEVASLAEQHGVWGHQHPIARRPGTAPSVAHRPHSSSKSRQALKALASAGRPCQKLEACTRHTSHGSKHRDGAQQCGAKGAETDLDSRCAAARRPSSSALAGSVEDHINCPVPAEAAAACQDGDSGAPESARVRASACGVALIAGPSTPLALRTPSAAGPPPSTADPRPLSRDTVLAVAPSENSPSDDEVDLVHGGVAPAEGEEASVPQAAAMVLNLDDPFSSTPSVLELELERMDLEELHDFEARMEKASIASGRMA